MLPICNNKSNLNISPANFCPMDISPTGSSPKTFPDRQFPLWTGREGKIPRTDISPIDSYTNDISPNGRFPKQAFPRITRFISGITKWLIINIFLAAKRKIFEEKIIFKWRETFETPSNFNITFNCMENLQKKIRNIISYPCNYSNTCQNNHTQVWIMKTEVKKWGKFLLHLAWYQHLISTIFQINGIVPSIPFC